MDLTIRIGTSDMVITGEGSFDQQSLFGKTTKGVIDRAKEAGARVAVLCGRAEAEVEGVQVRSLIESFGPDRAVSDARRALEDLAEQLASSPGP